ncbi:hypothetical protein M0R45_036896 [Rubus argutus]|uniref:Uncharacterized protein n=1 Tax=Rubus argutus TaxID=59490 RepID=A0AAW1W1B9_RUBAR
MIWTPKRCAPTTSARRSSLESCLCFTLPPQATSAEPSSRTIINSFPLLQICNRCPCSQLPCPHPSITDATHPRRITVASLDQDPVTPFSATVLSLRPPVFLHSPQPKLMSD